MWIRRQICIRLSKFSKQHASLTSFAKMRQQFLSFLKKWPKNLILLQIPVYVIDFFMSSCNDSAFGKRHPFSHLEKILEFSHIFRTKIYHGCEKGFLQIVFNYLGQEEKKGGNRPALQQPQLQAGRNSHQILP